MKKIVQIFLYVFFMIFGCFVLIKNLLFLNEVNTNYLEVDAVILKYKNYGSNYSLDNKDLFSIQGEDLILGYTFREKYYETEYSITISDDYNNMKTDSITKIKINPENPKEIILKSDKSYYVYVVIGFFLFTINIILFSVKITQKETDGY